jgi:Na+/H+ antiporter NhaD/arsenite permease-like protein
LCLAAGALLANVFGTTGASMLLIRPWIRMNKYRITAHHITFFIFLVSNVGGFLTPVGPPLLLGYLAGVPFWWVAAHGWPVWITGVAHRRWHPAGDVLRGGLPQLSPRAQSRARAGDGQ